MHIASRPYITGKYLLPLWMIFVFIKYLIAGRFGRP
jgi:hypothetical protein